MDVRDGLKVLGCNYTERFLIGSQTFNLIERNLSLLMSRDHVDASFSHSDNVEAHHRYPLDALILKKLYLSFMLIINADASIRASNGHILLKRTYRIRKPVLRLRRVKFLRQCR